MKNLLFLSAAAAVLSLASCSQEKTTETTAATEGTSMSTPANTAVVTDNDEAYNARAQRVADRFYTDMKITDEATRTKIRTAYYNRAKRMGDMRAKYKSDTTGMAAAMRESDVMTDTEMKGILTDPAQYTTYESSRPTYAENNYMDDMSSSTSAGSTDGSMSSGDNGGAMSSSSDGSTMNSVGTEAGKTKMEDGSKVKVQRDGDIKIKDAAGNKMKMDGDDGTVKMKPQGEDKTKIK